MPLKEVYDHFKAEGRVLKKAPVAFASCVLFLSVIIFLGIGWFEERHYSGVIIEKDATIAQKDAKIDNLQQDNHKLERDNGGYLQKIDNLANANKDLEKELNHSRFPWNADADLFFTNTAEPKVVSQIVLPEKGQYYMTMAVFTTNSTTAGLKCWFESSESGMLFIGELWVGGVGPVENTTHGGTHPAHTYNSSATFGCQLSFRSDRPNVVITLKAQQMKPENSTILFREGSRILIERQGRE